MISRRLYIRTWPACWYIAPDPDQQATLCQKNRTNILLYNTGSCSAGNLIPYELGKHAVQDQDQDSLLVKRRNDNHSPGPVIRELVPSSHQISELSNTILCIFSCYITLDHDKQATLYQPNRPRMLLYNTGSWSTGDFIAKNLVNIMLYNTGSWSAGDFIPETGQHAVI